MKTKKPATDMHHRKPRANGGTNDPENVRKVWKSKHQAFHHLCYEGSPHKVAAILSHWIDPDYKLIAVKRNSEEDFQGQGLA